MNILKIFKCYSVLFDMLIFIQEKLQKNLPIYDIQLLTYSYYFSPHLC